MEQTVMKSGARRAGWSEKENNLLWETADEAQQQGLPLKQVFERIAQQTGRQPNSIRNYYYAQVRQRTGAIAPRFVPFEEDEVEKLVEQVLRARAKGRSVRSCLQEISHGDHSLMLRYQNKYRSVLKNRPELIEKVRGELLEEGVECPPPEVRSRAQGSVEESVSRLTAAARQVGDGELIRALEVLTRLMLSGRSAESETVRLDRMNVRLDLMRLALNERTQEVESLRAAAQELIGHVKEFLILDEDKKRAALPGFCARVTECLGNFESKVESA